MYECDIVFLFDTSGSMGDHISKVKDVVENFTEKRRKAPCFSYGDVSRKKKLHFKKLSDIMRKNFSER